MKRVLIGLVLAVLMTACLMPVWAEEGGFVFADEIPEEYWKRCDQPGMTRRISYESKDYAGDGAPVTKHAVVYLPYGYSEDERYDVLILMHGVGGSEDEWGFDRPYGSVRNVVDNLIAKGDIRPLIIVMPNGRSTANYSNTSMDNAGSFYPFGQELRNDLLPYIDSHYATWGSLTPDDPTAAREHRAMAGLSMGGMQTINIGLCECPDLIASFGAFSAAPTSYTAAEIDLRLAAFPDAEILYFYSICGLQDSLYFAGSGAAKDLPAACDRFSEANWHWQERDGGHDFGIWNLGLYNFLRVFSSDHADS